ncbi:MAG: bis(5'-nucleosyl)-tetraphosphatase (symmetrical) YqeK [Oscillospiraceae bacterium]|jgi:nicotinate-nucleotide adenylyltransferase|nr:bis(5'-nucleosyl)-tetraphosphatase (symmetrical) YqeK [Oscillospiraceae bacterium]
MKIAILGGTFNPPHIGHLSYINNPEVCAAEFDKIIVIPSGDPPHKTLPEGSPDAARRFEMAKITFEGTGADVSDIEISSPDKSYTADTIRRLMAYYPMARFTLLMGTDMSATFGHWYDSDWLRANTDIMAIDRSLIPVSSTMVREALSDRRGREWLSDKTYAYIIKNRLYNAKPEWDWLRRQMENFLTDNGKNTSKRVMRRIRHIYGTEKAAIALAKLHGVDVDDAGMAAILHDITKLKNYEQHLTILKSYGIMSIDVDGKRLLHAVSGAAVAKFEFGASDEVCNAIRWHTTGKANMSTLEKIVYLADLTEETRHFHDARRLRKLTSENLDKALKLALVTCIGKLRSAHKTVFRESLDALDFLNSQQ